MITKAIVALTLMTVCVSARPASAEDEPPSTPASENKEAEALEMYKKGQTAYDAKSYSEAVAILESSLQLDRATDTILLIAHCYRQLGFTLRALKHYQEYLDEWKHQNPNTPSPVEAEVNGHIAAAKEKIRKQKAAEAAAKKEKKQRQQWAAEDKHRRQQALNEKLAQETARLERRRRILRIATISSVAATGAAAFLGGAFFAASDSAQHDQSFDSANRLSITGFVAAGVFGAAAVTCGVWYFLSRPEKPGLIAAAMISPSPDGVAASAAFRF